MSDDADKESKTELPTEKRIQDAIDRGNIPFSPEAGVLTGLAGILVAGLMVAGTVADGLFKKLRFILDNSANVSLSDGNEAFQIIMDQIQAIAIIIFPLIAVLCLGGVLGPLAQNVPQANLERLVPKPQRLSPSANFKRLFGKQAFFDLAKMVLKVAAVSLVAWWAIEGNLTRIVATSMIDVSAVPGLILSVVKSVIWPLIFVALIIAIVDIVVVRMRWVGDMMMTKQEVKDEHKQTEGDPMVKERARSIARQRLNSQMMKDLPKATLIIANPTHFAVALRYVPAEGGAPLVIAKGLDHLAIRIRELGGEQGIAVIENKVLARSLYGAVEVGQMIPAEFYRAVAEIIQFIEMKDRLAARRRTQV